MGDRDLLPRQDRDSRKRRVGSPQRDSIRRERSRSRSRSRRVRSVRERETLREAPYLVRTTAEAAPPPRRRSRERKRRSRSRSRRRSRSRGGAPMLADTVAVATEPPPWEAPALGFPPLGWRPDLVPPPWAAAAGRGWGGGGRGPLPPWALRGVVPPWAGRGPGFWPPPVLGPGRGRGGWSGSALHVPNPQWGERDRDRATLGGAAPEHLFDAGVTCGEGEGGTAPGTASAGNVIAGTLQAPCIADQTAAWCNYPVPSRPLLSVVVSKAAHAQSVLAFFIRTPNATRMCDATAVTTRQEASLLLVERLLEEA